MPPNASVEKIVIEIFQRTGPCFLDDLVKSTPSLSWDEVFAVVDKMSMDGRLWLRNVGYRTYAVMPHPQLAGRRTNIDPDELPDQVA